MKISLNWISDYVDIDKADIDTIIDKMTVTTCELEGVEKKGIGYDGLVVGQILSCVDHPDSDHLHLLRVDIGSEVLDIVCGAPNVRQGIKVVIVTVGGHIEGNKIKARKTAGYISYGMCCSAAELGISNDNDGIIVIDDSVSVGTDAAEYLDIYDTVLEIDNKSLTNRPDLWGHYGFAREVACMLDRPLKEMKVADISQYDALDSIDIKVSSEECHRYTGIVIDNITGKTPYYISRRLIYCDMRPINMLADLTNYIMMETSQPMHAFDANMAKGIHVMNIDSDREFTTLDGVSRILPKGSMVIADNDDKIIGIAGIMGGYDSEITDITNSVMIESASFAAAKVRKTASSIGLRTDASQHYEKTLDPEYCHIATGRYLQLLSEISPDAVVKTRYTDIYNYHYPSVSVTVSHNKIKRYMGCTISPDRVKQILTSLGMTVNNDNYDISIPSYRATKDISIAEDIIEEIARVYGYDSITPTPFVDDIRPANINTYHNNMYDIKKYLANRYDYNELHTYVFKNKNFIKEYNLPDTDNTHILGSYSPEYSELRNHISYSILQAVEENLKYAAEVKVFEIGREFDGKDDQGNVIENTMLCMAHASKSADIYQEMAKTVLALVKYIKGVDVEFDINNIDISHPKKSMDIIVSGNVIGSIYLVNPKISSHIGRCDICISQIDMKALYNVDRVLPKYTEVSKNPTITLDVSYILPKTMTYGELKRIIMSRKNRLLNAVEYIERYADDSMGDNVSMTIRYILGSMTKTLTSEDAKNFGDRIAKELLIHNVTPRY